MLEIQDSVFNEKTLKKILLFKMSILALQSDVKNISLFIRLKDEETVFIKSRFNTIMT
jgi:hypothetical protein